MQEGIDVSYYNPITDWDAIGKRFVIVRSGDGLFLDPQFGWNVAGAYGPGIRTDIYHYLRFALTLSRMAEILLARWDEAIVLAPIGRLWLDWEDTSDYFEMMTVGQRKAWMQGIATLVAHIPGGDYTAKWWVDSYLDGTWPSPWPANRLRWVAAYGPFSGFFQSDPTVAGFQPPLPTGWPDWDVWQYSSNGRVEGITGPVDLDVAKSGIFGQEGRPMDDLRLIDAQARTAIAAAFVDGARVALTGPVETLGKDIKAAVDKATETAKFWRKWEE